MMPRIRQFIRYARDYGLGSAVIYALLKLFPSKFVLVARLFQSRGGTSSVMSSVDYTYTVDSVFDYKSWTGYGGKSTPTTKDDSCFIWFVPDWLNVWGGGHYTLFRFAQHFAQRSRKRQIIFIYNNIRHAVPDALQKTLDDAFPNCMLEVIVDPELLPSCAAAIATTWQSAYHVRAFPFAKKKFYFMQDYESLFYAFGTQSMQANATYSFGFTGITGGGWLKSLYEFHGGKATNYRFAADKDIFFPEHRPTVKVQPRVSRVFFYGRPSTERRCFDLGMASLQKIAQEFPLVEIVIAGLDLEKSPPFRATLLGNMKLKDTGDLYRTCDIGIAFSGTNLSYLPVELMACGVPVISNRGPHVEWHCRHGENAYLTDPTPTSVLEAFRELYHNVDLRQKLAEGGVATMKELEWSKEMDKIHDYISVELELN